MSSSISRIVSNWAPRLRFMSLAGVCAFALALVILGPRPAVAQEEAASTEIE